MIYHSDFLKQLNQAGNGDIETNSALAVTVQVSEACNPVNDFRKSALILTITLSCLFVIILLALAFFCACRKYRKLHN
jgi:hypothetical protein